MPGPSLGTSGIPPCVAGAPLGMRCRAARSARNDKPLTELAIPRRERTLEEDLVEQRPLTERRRKRVHSASLSGRLALLLCLARRLLHFTEHHCITIELGLARERAVARHVDRP